MEKQIMNEEELAFYLHQTPAQVRKLRDRGMPVHFLGASENRDSRYILDEIVEWFRSRPDFLQRKPKKSKEQD